MILLIDLTTRPNESFFARSTRKASELVHQAFKDDASRPLQLMIVPVNGSGEGGEFGVLGNEILLEGTLRKVSDRIRFPKLAKSYSAIASASRTLVGMRTKPDEGTQIIRAISRAVQHLSPSCRESVNIHIFSDMVEQSDLLDASQPKALEQARRGGNLSAILDRMDVSSKSLWREAKGGVNVFVYGASMPRRYGKYSEPSDDSALRMFWQNFFDKLHWNMPGMNWDVPLPGP